MTRLVQFRKPNSILVALAVVCFTSSPSTHAALPPPPPDGAYPGANTAEGDSALFNLTTGVNNTALGYQALRANTTGSGNTAVGLGSLNSNTMGNSNTASGVDALFENTTGSQNTATGLFALFGNGTANNNTADGYNALASNSTGTGNTGTGAFALTLNNGNNNTAHGFQALFQNTTGASNTATGESALKSNTTASNNTAMGFQVSFRNTTGANNTAIGYHALANSTTGSSNIALGSGAGVNLSTGSNNIEIGSVGGSGESNTIRIGSLQTRTFIKGISGVTIAGAPVVVNSAGQLGVAPSSAQFKHKIRSMDKESEAVLALKPVSFCYDEDIDEQAQPQFGLVAEEVQKVNPDLVVRDENGEAYSVRYDQVNAMLLNEFLKEHRKVENLQAAVAQLTARMKEQDSKIEKMSDQLAMTRPAPNVVANNQ